MTDARRADRVEKIRRECADRDDELSSSHFWCDVEDLLAELAQRDAALARKQALIDGLRGDLDVHRLELERLREAIQGWLRQSHEVGDEQMLAALAPHAPPTRSEG